MVGTCKYLNVFLLEMGVALTKWRRFVATEEGILEYPVNIEERKTFPGMAFL